MAKLTEYFDNSALQIICAHLAEIRQLRDEFIRQEFDGHNHETLASKFDIDIRQVYRILKS